MPEDEFDTGEPLAPVDPNRIDQAMIDTIMRNMDVKTLAFQTKGAFSTSVKKEDGSYRTKPIAGSTDFALSGMRIGAKKQIIFEFGPIEFTDYVQMELDEKKVFGIFDGFEQMVVEAMGYTAAPKVVGWRGKAYTWESAKIQFRKDERNRLRNAAQKAKAEKKQAAADDYGTNPLFGSW